MKVIVTVHFSVCRVVEIPEGVDPESDKFSDFVSDVSDDSNPELTPEQEKAGYRLDWLGTMANEADEHGHPTGPELYEVS